MTGTGGINISNIPISGVSTAAALPGGMTEDNTVIGSITAENGSFVNLSVTGTATIEGGIIQDGDITLANGKALQTDTTTAHTGLIKAYDVDGAIYKTFATLTNGNIPSFAIAAPSGGLVTINGAVIGGTTAAAGTFSTLTANTALIAKGISNAGTVATGNIGEFISASLASGSAAALISTQSQDFCSIDLTAGIWHISGNATLTAGGSTIVTTCSAFIGTAAGDNTTGRNTAFNNTYSSVGANASSDHTLSVGPWQVNITTPTTYYMKTNAAFSVSTLSVYGHIQALRVA